MKLLAIIFTTLMLLSHGSGARNLKEPSHVSRKLGDTEIYVEFEHIKVKDYPHEDGEGHNLEFELDFEIEAFKVDMHHMSFESIAKDHDSDEVDIDRDHADDKHDLHAHVGLKFDNHKWESHDHCLRLYKITVSGIEWDHDGHHDELPSCYKVYNYEGHREFDDDMTCKDHDWEYKVYYHVKED